MLLLSEAVMLLAGLLRGRSCHQHNRYLKQ
jgi:hypothetical protein